MSQCIVGLGKQDHCTRRLNTSIYMKDSGLVFSVNLTLNFDLSNSLITCLIFVIKCNGSYKLRSGLKKRQNVCRSGRGTGMLAICYMTEVLSTFHTDLSLHGNANARVAVMRHGKFDWTYSSVRYSLTVARMIIGT